MIDQLEREILVRGVDDVIQLAEMVSGAHFEVGIDFGEDMFNAIAGCISSMVRNGLAEVGGLEPDGPTLQFVAWPGGADEVVRRVLTEWKLLGRDPNLSEVSWLSLTEKGRKAAETFLDP